MSNVEKLQELLGQFCAGGYSSGLVGEANARWVADNYDFVVVSDVYRVGYMACLLAGVDDDTEGVSELVELLEGLEDYPVIDENYLSDLVVEAEAVYVDDLARSWGISEKFVWDAVYELGGSFEWEQDYAYYADDVEELEAKARELASESLRNAQTWDVHYNSGQLHTPEVCGYCAEAEVA